MPFDGGSLGRGEEAAPGRFSRLTQWSASATVLSQAAFPLGGDEAAQLSRSIEQAVAAEQEAAAAARDAGRAAAAAAEAAKQAVEKAERAAAAEQAAAERAAEERAAADRADAFRVAAEIAEAIFASEALDDVGRAGKVRTLAVSLSQRRNGQLRSRVRRGSLTAKRLLEMSPEDLAPPERQVQRERARADAKRKAIIPGHAAGRFGVSYAGAAAEHAGRRQEETPDKVARRRAAMLPPSLESPCASPLAAGGAGPSSAGASREEGCRSEKEVEGDGFWGERTWAEKDAALRAAAVILDDDGGVGAGVAAEAAAKTAATAAATAVHLPSPLPRGRKRGRPPTSEFASQPPTERTEGGAAGAVAPRVAPRVPQVVELVRSAPDGAAPPAGTAVGASACVEAMSDSEEEKEGLPAGVPEESRPLLERSRPGLAAALAEKLRSAEYETT
ncbi:hypothetical protein EMIHUDRAFT_469093 [Emiliania huxleyi CCMP1516]|uniref:TFIIS central domain-containing protein n=2 Tax=Emiliania huxleyi TaxID=2903 RepID=A0A0D3JR77_EMIH1|nr:hypothetical protein EMIHUDRAFT_469093 [Emiliania huxleyi CCMP1516]EOD26012.1 hypothetical protein EMIHUDRAFT_469093 [Emiliania huxleyi CCMP1516]|eukprot:XP_005778441.1 hypothetical protein EMIHUDRAFT_469093 [Emiliania huxleyi CCMP1516]